jgi:hypothetical protein
MAKWCVRAIQGPGRGCGGRAARRGRGAAGARARRAAATARAPPRPRARGRPPFAPGSTRDAAAGGAGGAWGPRLQGGRSSGARRALQQQRCGPAACGAAPRTQSARPEPPLRATPPTAGTSGTPGGSCRTGKTARTSAAGAQWGVGGWSGGRVAAGPAGSGRAPHAAACRRMQPPTARGVLDRPLNPSGAHAHTPWQALGGEERAAVEQAAAGGAPDRHPGGRRGRPAHHQAQDLHRRGAAGGPRASHARPARGAASGRSAGGAAASCAPLAGARNTGMTRTAPLPRAYPAAGVNHDAQGRQAAGDLGPQRYGGVGGDVGEQRQGGATAAPRTQLAALAPARACTPAASAAASELGPARQAAAPPHAPSPPPGPPDQGRDRDQGDLLGPR